MWTVARWYTQFGLMAGTVFREVLRDLEVEGLEEEAAFVRGGSLYSTNTCTPPVLTCTPPVLHQHLYSTCSDLHSTVLHQDVHSTCTDLHSTCTPTVLTFTPPVLHQHLYSTCIDLYSICTPPTPATNSDLMPDTISERADFAFQSLISGQMCLLVAVRYLQTRHGEEYYCFQRVS